MSFATIQVLEEEKVKFTERAEFLKSYIEKLRTNEYDSEEERFEALDKAYRLSSELDFKERVIEQRVKQIEFIQKEEELKEKAIKELPEKVEQAKEVYNSMLDDLDGLKKMKKSKEVHDAIKMVEGQADQTDGIIESVVKRMELGDTKQLLADFRVIDEIIKLKK